MKAKPVTSLSSKDFRLSVIWRYAEIGEYGAEDETWVVPELRLSKIPNERYSLLIFSRFVLANDTMLSGFMDVSTPDKRIEVLPGAVLEPSYCVLPLVSREQAELDETPDCVEERDRVLRLLSFDEEDVFPIQYLLKAKRFKSDEVIGGFIY